MEMFGEILRALETNERVMLATIIATSGSTPASAFSKMLVKEGGLVSVGSVGGGCMEGDVLLAAKKLFPTDRSDILTFHLQEDEYVQGLICGGSLDVLIEPYTAKEIPLLQELKERRLEGEDTVLATLLDRSGQVTMRRLVRPRPSGWIQEDLENLREEIGKDLLEELQKCLYRYETRRIILDRGELLLEPIAGLPSLVIFGGGHVSRSISKAASLAGFRVTIVDDREEYANRERFPEAAETFVLPMEEALKKVPIRASTYVVIVTRGHRMDEEILENILPTPAAYIGMIGSKRKVLTTYEHLMARGVSESELRRVYAPVGIEIGAVTPEEIAISIVAQLIRVRRRVTTSAVDKSEVMKPLIALRKRKMASR